MDQLRANILSFLGYEEFLRLFWLPFSRGHIWENHAFSFTLRSASSAYPLRDWHFASLIAMRLQTCASATLLYLAEFSLREWLKPSVVSYVGPFLIWQVHYLANPYYTNAHSSPSHLPCCGTFLRFRTSGLRKIFFPNFSCPLIAWTNFVSFEFQYKFSMTMQLALACVFPWVSQLIQMQQPHNQPYTCPMHHWTLETALSVPLLQLQAPALELSSCFQFTSSLQAYSILQIYLSIS